MTGFPLLMYYLWICLWFYDGKLVYPDSVDDIKPFLFRMWEHVRQVCFLLFCVQENNLNAWIGRKPKCLRMESVQRKLFLPALHCFNHSWLPARRSPRPLSWI